MLNTHKAQTAQALVEFCVIAAAVLFFLTLSIPFLSKITETRIKTLQGARYSAWERTIYYDKSEWKKSFGATKDIAALNDETNLRIMAKNDDQIGIKYKNGDVPIEKFLFFYNRYKSKYEEFVVNQSGSSEKRYMSIRENNLAAPLSIPFGGNVFNAMNMPTLPENGFYNAYVMLETKPLSWWKEFDEIIAPEATNVILADGWSAGTGVGLQSKMKEGYLTGINNTLIKPLNAMAPVLSAACIGIGVKCGRDLEDDRLSEISTSPNYVPKQRLE